MAQLTILFIGFGVSLQLTHIKPVGETCTPLRALVAPLLLTQCAIWEDLHSGQAQPHKRNKRDPPKSTLKHKRNPLQAHKTGILHLKQMGWGVLKSGDNLADGSGEFLPQELSLDWGEKSLMTWGGREKSAQLYLLGDSLTTHRKVHVCKSASLLCATEWKRFPPIPSTLSPTDIQASVSPSSYFEQTGKSDCSIWNAKQRLLDKEGC